MTVYVCSVIILTSLVTLIVRVVPLIMISRLDLSEQVIKWLSFIPITLFTALVVDGLMQQQPGVPGYTINWLFVIALVPTMITALRFKSLTLTVLVGLVTVALLRFVQLF
ncbi:AzlD domain-containing protein [Staphylococcus sp. 17KM0847]|uniref:AzlD domain-containing protein n=1 Tax=Staphylococcus sp. 17KM0847 TaxID=2583989 RepID=UPI0015DC5CB4|nr:AzlD domain-containing protein [Staphylococcus sp. 17KM0847]QLK85215.1 AzlD domain-containing protein [Staphylococcus sp. 17KM0847]